MTHPTRPKYPAVLVDEAPVLLARPYRVTITEVPPAEVGRVAAAANRCVAVTETPAASLRHHVARLYGNQTKQTGA